MGNQYCRKLLQIKAYDPTNVISFKFTQMLQALDFELLIKSALAGTSRVRTRKIEIEDGYGHKIIQEEEYETLENLSYPQELWAKGNFEYSRIPKHYQGNLRILDRKMIDTNPNEYINQSYDFYDLHNFLGLYVPVSSSTCFNLSLPNFVQIKSDNPYFQLNRNDIDNYDKSEFYMTDTQISRGVYFAMLGYDPSANSPKWEQVRNPNQVFDILDAWETPVTRVSLYDAFSFCNTLSVFCGLKPYYRFENIRTEYVFTDSGEEFRSIVSAEITIPNPYIPSFRIPTLYDWELSAQGNHPEFKFSGSNSIEDVAIYRDFCKKHKIFPRAPQRSKILQPNDFGLFDMTGNVREWVHTKLDPEDFDKEIVHYKEIINKDGEKEYIEQRPEYKSALMLSKGGGYDDEYPKITETWSDAEERWIRHENWEDSPLLNSDRKTYGDPSELYRDVGFRICISLHADVNGHQRRAIYDMFQKMSARFVKA